MPMNTSNRKLKIAFLFVFAALLGWCASAEENRDDRYLFICAGNQARTAPDFPAVVNFDQRSDDYGKVIATAPFAAPDATGNEPHLGHPKYEH